MNMDNNSKDQDLARLVRQYSIFLEGTFAHFSMYAVPERTLESQPSFPSSKPMQSTI